MLKKHGKKPPFFGTKEKLEENVFRCKKAVTQLCKFCFLICGLLATALGYTILDAFSIPLKSHYYNTYIDQVFMEGLAEPW